MNFVVTEPVIGLSESPDDGARHLGTVVYGDRVEKINDADNAGWVKVAVLPEREREGFLPLHALEPVTTPSQDIDKEQFYAAVALAARVSAVDDEYLYGLAVAQSGLKNISNPVPGSDGFGPFQFSIARWADLVGRFGAEENITADDRSVPFAQVVLAARYTRLLTDGLKTALKREPQLNELFAAHLLGEDAGRIVLAGDHATFIDTALQNAPGAAALRKAVADNPQIFPQGNQTTIAQALAAAATKLQPGLDAAAQVKARLNPPGAPAPGPIQLNLRSVDPKRLAIAQMIVSAFADAGFDDIHQAAALANAIRESGLIPTKENIALPKEFSVGLFQMNMMGGGRGSHNTELELKDPNINIGIVVKAAQNIRDQLGRNFRQAKTIEEAVGSFVRDFENPKNPQAEIALRLTTAKQLLA
jgi:Phage tail lysozyme